MPFLTQAIRSQKLLEAEVELEKFIEDNGITDEMVIFSASFDKSVFESEVEVKEYLNDKFYTSDNITDNGDAFTAGIMNTFQVDLDSIIEIELRRGVTVKAANLLPQMPQDVSFNEGEVVTIGASELQTFNLSVKDIEICLNSGLPHIIEVCRVAEGYHANYGQIKITKENLESMERNFQSKITGVDLAINEDHKKNEAFAWFKDVFLSHDKNTLYAQVVWNAKGTQALSEKEYRYFSPEFRFSYTHPHTNVEHGPTLLGGALTNYPFLKMDAITELNNKNNREVKVMSEKTIALSEHQTQVLDLNSKIRDFEKGEDVFKNTITTLKGENVELNEKVSTLEKEKADADRTATNDKLFAENKINKAQLVALNEGKSITDVLELGSKLNTKASGSSETVDNDIELSDEERAMALKMDLTDAEFVKYGRG